jgi:transposase InsO family protein
MRFDVITLRNRQRYLICTTTADSGRRRSPLTIAVTRPGENVFRKVFVIRHADSDKGKQFCCQGFKDWCQRKRLRPRFGAIGQHGSIAVVERFIQTVKIECTRKPSAATVARERMLIRECLDHVFRGDGKPGACG